ncbi:dedicator of cytokinesis protein 1 [Patella vulgata]|uniref:dedicator of cytokinesis protein 1 n=1 Tax=Patella vulgata TaxID=6465 RepID=UPI002180761C|nr:dedicator of cytokinesis protein 1 [Patella vulgata]
MTVWRKTDAKTKLCVAIYNYNGAGDHKLQLDVGDAVQIIEECEEWYRGFAIKNKRLHGIFPKSYVCVKECVSEMHGGMEIITPKEPLVAQEISSVLKEWNDIWKMLYVIRGKDFDRVKDMLTDLFAWRQKALSRKLTIDELGALQQQVTMKIDYGNALLNRDLVVRDNFGNMLNLDHTSIIEVYRRHVTAAETIKNIKLESSGIEVESESKFAWPSTFNLFVMLRNFVVKIGEDADILMNLYDSKEGKFISENYIVKWTKEGVPKDIDMLNNFKVVFTDLGTKDRLREKVFLVFQIIRIGVMDTKAQNPKNTQRIRRPFGVAAMDISELIQGTKEYNEDQQHFIPFQQCGEEFMETVTKKVIVAKDINHKGQGIWVSMKVLSGDLKQVQEDYPHVISQGCTFARKIGFPEVIMPGDVRNDIYITIMSGEFYKSATKTTDRNVEVTVLVCNSRGDALQQVISHGCGDEMCGEYKSMVYYHEDKPKWHETLKVTISSTEEEFRGLHLKFLFKHRSSAEAKDRSEKPFAMSYIRLMNENGTTMEDCVHELLVYKLECKKHEDRGYLNLPTNKKELEHRYANHPSGKIHVQSKSGSIVYNSKDSFTMETYVCSTKLTNNLDLLGLLKWQEVLSDTKSLQRHLEHLMKEEGEEIVKFLQDLLDSLFNILMQNTNSELCDNLVFDALVYIIALISDRKYHQFRPVLDAYIDSNFSFAMAYNKLMAILKYYVDNANEKSDHEQPLLRAMKSLEYILKFVIKSRLLFAMINEGRGKQQFEMTLKQLLLSINGMMMYTSDQTLLVQGAALKYISSIVADVITVFDPVELATIMVQFIANVPKDRLARQKMKCIDDLIHTDLFKRAECRQVLIKAIFQHTKEMMEKNVEIEACVDVLSDIMHCLYLPETGIHDSDLTIVTKSILRTVIQTVIGMDRKSTAVGKCVSVMLSILRQMSENHYLSYIESFPTTFDLLDFLMEILMVFQDLFGHNVFPRDWVEMVMIQNSIILRALRFFANTIHDKFSNPFEQQLWNNFFHCAKDFLTQDALQLERFTQTKRNKIVTKYKDMRREAGFEIRSMWFNLGPNKIHFIPDLVGPILEVTLIPETELRKATIPIFFDMMQCEFGQPIPKSNRIQGNFNFVENEMITQLDVLVEEGRGDPEYQELMYEILYNKCDGHSTMREQGLSFVEMIQKLLQRLLEYRLIMKDEVKEHRMSCIVNLLDFYHAINRQEMYIRYLHKLHDLHMECDNFTEAGYTLILYAKLLNWSEEQLPPMLHNNKYPEAITHRELKEYLYYDIISCFDKGKMWEKGIELCKELTQLYEKELFDYMSLSKTHKRLAELFDNIMRQMRPEPEYFRVGYYGWGFPSFLQNKAFIYRGKEYERLVDFNARMQILFPNAELMKTLDPPTDEIKESPRQHLQINAVSPIMELKEPFKNKQVGEQILKYYMVNEVQKFTYSRKSDESPNDVTKMWLERTNLVTSYPLPGIVGWYPVVSMSTFAVSPLESAIETLENKNKKILSMIEQHRLDPNLRVDPLGMLLNGVVDPAVNGGISMYKVFYNGEYLLHSECQHDSELIEKLKQLTLQQVTLLRDALMIHRRKAPENLKPFHTHMEQRFAEMCNIIEKEYGIKVADKGFASASLRRNQSLPNTAIGRTSGYYPSTSSSSSSDINSLTPNKYPSGHRTQSVWVRPDKTSVSPGKTSLQSKMGNIIKRASAVADSITDNRTSLEQPIELSEQLVTRRPPRPESDKNSRPVSNQFRSDNLSTSSLSLASNTTATSDTSDAFSSDEPPPLPEKSAYADYTNTVDVDPQTLPRRPSATPSIKNKPQPPLPEADRPPPVPKKPH